MSREPIDVAQIRALAQILADTGLTEIEVDDGVSRVRVARAPVTMAAPAPVMVTGAPVLAAPASAPAAAVDPATHPGAVTSPMVGVVYLSAEPGLPPYVTAGQAVVAGQTLLLIEAMKTYNQIKAPRAGVVSRILAATGVPVEFGEVLLVIE